MQQHKNLRGYQGRTSLTRATIILFLLILLYSCRAVKPWQRVYLNDDAMQMGKRTVEKYSTSVHSYREAASGGGTGKGSGGCGCN
jgi:Domain of unknown function (DUF4266)